jgi:hypothetical protein
MQKTPPRKQLLPGRALLPEPLPSDEVFPCKKSLSWRIKYNLKAQGRAEIITLEMKESPGGDAGIREKIILLTSGFHFRFDQYPGIFPDRERLAA